MKLYSLWHEVTVPVRQTAADATIIIVDEVEIVRCRRWIHVPLADAWYRVEMRWARLFTWRARFRTIRGKDGQ